nr:cold-shock protein [Paenibacillus cymbidii]
MYHSRKRPLDDTPLEMTPVWSCSNENCKGWMRDNFSLSVAPVCPQCHSVMVKGERNLIALANTSHNQIKQ